MSYCGPMKAVIFDWAGTTIDFGYQAPVVVLQEVFEKAGVPITPAEARKDMGLPKKDHIRVILAQPRVAKAWADCHGETPVETDVECLYREFAPLQIERLPEYSDVIESVPQVVEELRRRGLKIGSSTGYTRQMLDPLMERAARQGYRPDVSVTPEECAGGRPAPWMCLANMTKLGVYPTAACVKVGDTPADIEEGLNAGMWTVGITDSGNEVGLTYQSWQALDDGERQCLRKLAAERLWRAGAHYVIHNLAELIPLLDDLE